jgi:hypothetical protein
LEVPTAIRIEENYGTGGKAKDILGISGVVKNMSFKPF